MGITGFLVQSFYMRSTYLYPNLHSKREKGLRFGMPTSNLAHWYLRKDRWYR
jgi:hypothetical protein